MERIRIEDVGLLSAESNKVLRKVREYLDLMKSKGRPVSEIALYNFQVRMLDNEVGKLTGGRHTTATATYCGLPFRSISG